MAAPGLPTSWKLEVELVPGSGTYVDITADVAPPITIRQGRSGLFDDAQPGALTATVYNDTGKYTPESALATRGLIKGQKIRYSIVKSAVTYWQYRGRVKTADAVTLDKGRAAVTFTCLDALGTMQQRTLAMDWVEAWAYRSATQTCDCWPMDDDTAATTIRNIGSGVGTMTVRASAAGLGSSERGDITQGILLPGAITLTPNDAGVGPVVAVDLGRALGTNAVVTFAVSTTATTAAGDLVLATALDTAGRAIWSLRLSPSGAHTALVLYDEIAPGYAMLSGELDGSDKWLGFSFYDSGTNAVLFINNGVDGGAVLAQRCNTLRYLVLGGQVASWKLLGKQTLCPPMQVAGVAAATSSTTDLMDRARPLVVTGATTRLNELTDQYCAVNRTWTGTIVPGVTRTNSAGRSALDCLNQLIGTIGGTVWTDYTSGVVTTTMPDTSKPVTSSATIQVEADDDVSAASMSWSAPGDTTPTRVTVGSAFGSKTARNAYAEAVQGLRQEETWDSCAASDIAAGALAGARLNRALTARIPAIGIDLVTSATDRYAAMLALVPGARITMTGLPSTLVGVTQADCYVLGWTETWGAQSIVFVLDLVLADKPSELRLDDATYSRLPAGEDAFGVPLMTVTSGTAVGGTGNGTLVITTSSGPTLSTAAGSYPMDLDWAGERVTITSAPGGSSSPQTVTTTTRGKSPTVARTHAAGDPIDVWMPSTTAGV